MQAAGREKKTLQVAAAIRAASGVFSEQYGPLLILMLAGIILGAAGRRVYLPALLGEPMALLGQLLLVLGGSYYGALLYRFAMESFREKSEGNSEVALRWDLPSDTFFRLAGGNTVLAAAGLVFRRMQPELVTSLGLGGATLFELILGVGTVYLSMTFIYWALVCVDENCGVEQALRRSARLSLGTRWAFLGYLVLLGLIAVLITLPFAKSFGPEVIVNYLLLPGSNLGLELLLSFLFQAMTIFFLLVLVWLYEDLKRQEAALAA